MSKPSAPVFYVWQDTLPAKACKNLLLEALRAAIDELKEDTGLELMPELDRDTLNLPGAPSIADVILEKISVASVVVADLSITGTGHPNPNVLFELGYAAKALGFDRLVLVQNLAFGKPEDLPFDLRHRRILTYHSGEETESRAKDRKGLTSSLSSALKGALKIAPPQSLPGELILKHSTESQTQRLHLHRLHAGLLNSSGAKLREWSIEVALPREAIRSPDTAQYAVPNRSTREILFFRLSSETRGPIEPGDTVQMNIEYKVDDGMYEARHKLWNSEVILRGFADGKALAEKSVRFEDLQNF